MKRKTLIKTIFVVTVVTLLLALYVATSVFQYVGAALKVQMAENAGETPHYGPYGAVYWTAEETENYEEAFSERATLAEKNLVVYLCLNGGIMTTLVLFAVAIAIIVFDYKVLKIFFNACFEQVERKLAKTAKASRAKK